MKLLVCTLCALFTLPLSAVIFVVPSGDIKTTTLDLPDDGDSAIIEKGAAIDVAGADIDGVTMSNINQAVLNQGRVSTTGDGAVGIFNSSNANAVITNTGLISTIGDTMGGNVASGIFNDGGDNAVITNSGRITTTGLSATGIEVGGDNVTVTNSGLISTTGDSGAGITGADNNGVFINSGRILTSGPDGIGIGVIGASSNTLIINSGLISTRGNGGDGILNGNNNVVIANSGIITTRGTDADGVFNGNTSDNLLIINSGTIKAAQASVFNLDGTNVTISLLRGSNLQGPVVVVNPVTLNVETGLNLALTLASGSFGAFGIEAPFIHLGQTVAVIDPTGFALQADVVADLSDTILNGIYRHKIGFPCSCPCLPFDCGMWFQGIGSTRMRSKDSSHVGYDNWQGGFLAGHDTLLCGGNINFFGGISSGEATVDENTQHADTTSYLAGVAYERICGNTFFGLAFAAAYVDWDNDRFVMNNLALEGVDTAKFETGGAFISPEVTYARRFAALWYYPTLSFTLRYAGLFLGDYSEEGSLTNLSVKNRNISLLTTRFEIAVPYTDSWGLCCWSIEPYVGVFGRYQLSSNTVNAELLGQPLSFNSGNPRNLAALLIGFRGIQNFDDFNLFLNLEASFDNYTSRRILGEGGIGFSF